MNHEITEALAKFTVETRLHEMPDNVLEFAKGPNSENDYWHASWIITAGRQKNVKNHPKSGNCQRRRA